VSPATLQALRAARSIDPAVIRAARANAAERRYLQDIASAAKGFAEAAESNVEPAEPADPQDELSDDHRTE
jgi:hypothetical protein